MPYTCHSLFWGIEVCSYMTKGSSLPYECVEIAHWIHIYSQIALNPAFYIHFKCSVPLLFLKKQSNRINMSATDTNLGINTVPFSFQFSNKPIIHFSMNLVLSFLCLFLFSLHRSSKSFERQRRKLCNL